MKKQRYMTYKDRIKLETMLDDKMGVSSIAKKLGFCRQTIYNEIERGSYMHDYGWYTKKRYSADRAEARTREAQSHKGKQLKIGTDREYANFLEKKIRKEKYSPAAALVEAKKEGYRTSICTTTLYSYIDKKVFHKLTNKDLLVKSKKKRHRKKEKRIAHPKLPSIEERPEHINQREQYGHWESDLIIGKKETKPVLLTLTERKRREEIILRLPNKKAETIKRAIDDLERKTPNFKTKFKSITTDNGSEFLRYQELQESIYGGKRFDIYYCHSFCSWEKGTVENHNRMIRRFFPKGTDFSQVTEEDVKKVEEWMNSYPRRILGWLSPKEVSA